MIQNRWSLISSVLQTTNQCGETLQQAHAMHQAVLLQLQLGNLLWIIESSLFKLQK